MLYKRREVGGISAKGDLQWLGADYCAEISPEKKKQEKMFKLEMFGIVGWN